MSYAQVVRPGVLILPEHRVSALAETWSRAEGLGFDHAWTCDHIAWRDLRDSTLFAAVPTLAAAVVLLRSNGQRSVRPSCRGSRTP